MSSFIVHAPWPYCHRSGGIRALYKLADELRSRDERVGIASLGPAVWGSDPDPFGIGTVDDWSPEEFADAIHVIPEITQVLRGEGHKVIRWLLGPRRCAAGANELEITWTHAYDPSLQRLTVEIIERENFYPKTKPGDGVLYWTGKGTATHVEPHWRHISHEWPANRSHLGDALRAAGLLISFDGNSALNFEAALCGTPVLLRAPFVEAPPYSLFGIARDESEIDEAWFSVNRAAEEYQRVRDEMAKDVDRFIDLAKSHF